MCWTSRTIGLNARENQILLNALQKLGEQGSTLVVVEHDEDDHPPRRQLEIVTSAPARASAAGAWWPRARWPTAGGCGLADRRYLLMPCATPLQARRPVDAIEKVADGAYPAGAARPKTIAEPLVATVHGQPANPARSTARAVESTGWCRHGREPLGQVHAGQRRRTLLAYVAAWVGQRATQGRRGAMDAGQGPPLAGAPACRVRTIDRVWRWTRRPSARPGRAAAPPPTSASARPSASWSAEPCRPARLCTRGELQRFNTGEGRCPACEGRACAPSR